MIIRPGGVIMKRNICYFKERKKFIGQSNGQIRIDSEINKSYAFLLTLPLTDNNLR